MCVCVCVCVCVCAWVGVVHAGMDFKGVNLVVNFDFPQTPTSYIHRIGRTGRAGRSGQAVTFFTDQDADSIRAIATVMRQSGCHVEDWMLTLKKSRLMLRLSFVCDQAAFLSWIEILAPPVRRRFALASSILANVKTFQPLQPTTWRKYRRESGCC